MSQTTITLRYFAWMREHIGTDSEELPLPDGTGTIADLLPHLRARSDGHAPSTPLLVPAVAVIVLLVLPLLLLE